MKRNNRKTVRRTTDIVMLCFMPLMMSFSLTGQRFHEYFGIAAGVCFLVHLLLNRKWLLSLTKSRYTVTRTMHTLLNLALLAVVFLQMLSGIMIAGYLPLHGPASGMKLFTELHTNLAYIGFVLMCLHAAIHIHPFRGREKKLQKKAKTILMLLVLLASILLAVAWKQANQKRFETEIYSETAFKEETEIAEKETDIPQVSPIPTEVPIEIEKTDPERTPESDDGSALATGDTEPEVAENETQNETPEPSDIRIQLRKQEIQETEKEAEETTQVQTVNITLEFNRASTPASNQIAVWVEDESGNLVRTLFVTNFTAAVRGYEWRPMSLNHWLAAADPSSMDDQEINAISGATPGSGSYIFEWDLSDEYGNLIPDGTYVIKVEGTLYWESNIMYEAVIDTENAGGDIVVSVQRSEPENTQNENMLLNVSVWAR